MSQPKRYGWMVNAENDFDIVEHPNGQFIQWDDYAALQDQIAVLEAKVEWLRKADRLVVWNGKEWEPRIVKNP